MTELGSHKCLRSDYVEDLNAALETDMGIARYAGPSFALNSERVLITPIVRSTDTPWLLSADGSTSTRDDGRNAILVHKYLRELQPNQAADPRLWSYLTHSEFFEYTRERWPGGRSKNPASHIRNRYFMRGGRSGLLGNAIARLWWGAHLTHAPWERDEYFEPLRAPRRIDPYVYTRRFLSDQNVFQGIMARRFASSARIRICLLEALERRADAQGRIPRISDISKHLDRGINFVCSYRVLGALPFEALLATMQEHVDRAWTAVEGGGAAEASR